MKINRENIKEITRMDTSMIKNSPPMTMKKLDKGTKDCVCMCICVCIYIYIYAIDQLHPLSN